MSMLLQPILSESPFAPFEPPPFPQLSSVDSGVSPNRCSTCRASLPIVIHRKLPPPFKTQKPTLFRSVSPLAHRCPSNQLQAAVQRSLCPSPLTELPQLTTFHKTRQSEIPPMTPTVKTAVSFPYRKSQCTPPNGNCQYPLIYFN